MTNSIISLPHNRGGETHEPISDSLAAHSINTSIHTYQWTTSFTPSEAKRINTP